MSLCHKVKPTTICVLGSSKVGKSALISSFLFPQQKLKMYQKTILKQTVQQRVFYSTVGENIELHPVILNLLECSEMALLGQASRPADSFLLVYNVNDDKSWQFLKRIYDDVKRFEKPVVICGIEFGAFQDSNLATKQVIPAGAQTLSMLIPNRAVSLSAVQTWAISRNLPLFEVSLGDNSLLEAVFRELVSVPNKTIKASPPPKPKSLFSRMSHAIPRIGKTRAPDPLETSADIETDTLCLINHPLLKNTVISTFPRKSNAKILQDRDIAWQNFISKQ